MLVCLGLNGEWVSSTGMAFASREMQSAAQAHPLSCIYKQPKLSARRLRAFGCDDAERLLFSHA
jgi:hypothetical protein